VQSEEIKDLQIGKEDIKLPLFVNDIISFIKKIPTVQQKYS
jgi:hypothetical protein